jgi:thiol-disulfide isomerase/thioredoxin
MISSLTLGPFAIPLAVVWLLLAVAAALVAGRLAGRRRKTKTTDTLLTMVLIGALAARAAFVLQFLPEYLHHPLGILDIRDGGFNVFAGLVAIALYAAAKFRRRPEIARPLAIAMLTGVLTYSATGGALSLMHSARPTRPDITLTTLDGETTTLGDIALAHPDQPMVVNLWASWCPPCRTEMPMLAAAQARHDDVTFVFANQGESTRAARQFLSAESLTMRNVLLDPTSRLAQSVGSHAWPTTLFYDASGRLVDRHMGMLSRATLARALERVNTASAHSSSDPEEL